MVATPFSFFKKLKPAWLNLSPICLLCLARVTQGKLSICEDCNNELPRIIQGCNCCGLPIPYQGLCGQCLKQPPAYTKVIAPFRYDFPIAQLITHFKYQQQWPIGLLLAELLIAQLEHHYSHDLTKPDYLVAVPQAKQRLKERGFNQAAMLATWLSKKLAINLDNHNLQRVINTPPQQKLVAKERYKNLKNAFSLKTAKHFQQAHVAIIDDVVTTGTTANTLAKLLVDAGAIRVDVYAIARTPQTFK